MAEIVKEEKPKTTQTETEMKLSWQNNSTGKHE